MTFDFLIEVDKDVEENIIKWSNDITFRHMNKTILPRFPNDC
jgi:hypothetical protein